MSASDKTDNGDLEGKLLVRRHALELALRPTLILDCFAGEGHMYRLAWKDAASQYLGMDKRFSRRAGDAAGECMRGDNERLIDRAMKRADWNLVDLDAYGNPWPLLRAVLKRAKVQHLVVTATCGIDRAIRVGTSDFAAALAGASRLTYTGLLTRWYDDVIRWALAWATGGTAYQVFHACRVRGAANAQMRYWLLEFRRKTANDASAPKRA